MTKLIKKDGNFKIRQRSNGMYFTSLHASNGQTLMTSMDYTSIEGVENGIFNVRKNCK